MKKFVKQLMAQLQLHSVPLGVLRHLHADKAAGALLAAFHRRGETALARRALALLEDVAAGQAAMNREVLLVREAAAASPGDAPPCAPWMHEACLHPRAAELLPWARAALVELHCGDGDLVPALRLLRDWEVGEARRQEQVERLQRAADEQAGASPPRPVGGPAVVTHGA